MDLPRILSQGFPMVFRWGCFLVLGLFSCRLLVAEPARVLFVAGEASHGWNEHEFPAGCQALAAMLNASGLAIEAEVSLGWPSEPGALEGIDAIVLYCDGGAQHVLEGRVAESRQLFRDGVGFAFLHYAVEPNSEELAAFMLEAIGGYFEVDWSVNPVWSLRDTPDVQLGMAEAAAGVSLLETKDEWYYHMRFREDGEFEPLLSALPPLETLGPDGPRSGNSAVRAALAAGDRQHLAWTRIDSGGRRGMGFTGGHFHTNWNDDAFRKLVLNGIAWTAGLNVPLEGVVSKSPDFVAYETIDEAIARGDLEDVGRHLLHSPELLSTPGRGGMTPLQQAILRKKTDIALELLRRGADPNYLSGSQQTGLHLAVVRNLPALCWALAAAGVDLGARDKQGWTALHLAAAKNQPEMVGALLDVGSDVRRLSAAGGTALHEAAASGGKEVVQLLLAAGADPQVISAHGVSALEIAREYKNQAALELLESL